MEDRVYLAHSFLRGNKSRWRNTSATDGREQEQKLRAHISKGKQKIEGVKKEWCGAFKTSKSTPKQPLSSKATALKPPK